MPPLLNGPAGSPKPPGPLGPPGGPPNRGGPSNGPLGPPKGGPRRIGPSLNGCSEIKGFQDTHCDLCD